MSNASHPYDARHFAASDDARSAAAAQASAAQAAPDAPTGPVSEAARRAERRTSPAGGRAWKHALAALTAALLPPCIAIIDPSDEAAGADAPAEEPTGAANSPANDWLKLDEHGEPCEVRLADGTALKLDTYGGRFQGFDEQPPRRGEDAERVFGEALLNSLGWDSLALDVKHRLAYWIEYRASPLPPVARIMQSKLDGRNRKALMKFSDILPDRPTPDPEHGKLYWRTRGHPDGSEQSIYCGNLNASNGSAVISGMRDFRGFAIHSGDEKLYYFDEGHLIQTELDGSDEHALLDNVGGTIAIDPDGGKLYWRNGPRHLRRANLDGSEIEDVVDVLDGRITTFALDHVAKKIYWVFSTNIRRSNFDGSKVQDVLVGMVGHTDRIAIDDKDSCLYWMASKPIDGFKHDVGLWRLKLNKPNVAKNKRAPPVVAAMIPSRQSARGELTLEGANFTEVTQVLFIDDSTGQSKKAIFNAISDSALSLTVPKMSSGCKHPVIIVQNKGGVTATLPRDARVVQHQAVDRFHPDDQFTYVVPARASLSIDRGVILVLAQATATAKQYGKNTFFLKNNSVSDLRGAPDNLIYLEPSATLNHLDKLTKGSKVVRVPAIRPSFLENLFEYQQPE